MNKVEAWILIAVCVFAAAGGTFFFLVFPWLVSGGH